MIWRMPQRLDARLDARLHGHDSGQEHPVLSFPRKRESRKEIATLDGRDIPRFVARVMLALCLWGLAGFAAAQTNALGSGISLDISTAKSGTSLSAPFQILLGLTLLTLLPAMLVAMTAFTRIVIVLSLLRHAIGTQETPPNTVLISIALFLTLFTMTPTLDAIDRSAWQPYQAGKMNEKQAMEQGSVPLREFMLRQTREQDLALMVEIAKAEVPKTPEEVRFVHLVPAFMLSELRTAFQIGFVIFLPFLLIDLVVASILMSLGMMMVPPVMISLPLKILMFVLIDGWDLVVKALVTSFR